MPSVVVDVCKKPCWLEISALRSRPRSLRKTATVIAEGLLFFLAAEIIVFTNGRWKSEPQMGKRGQIENDNDSILHLFQGEMQF